MIDFSKIKSKKEVGKCFDYAILPKQTTEQTIRDCCKEAIKYNCKAFCFSSSYWTPIVAEELKGTDILVGAAIGFPFGQQTSAVKAFEAGIDWVKSSTGQYAGPTLEQVILMADCCKGTNTRVKVSGVKDPRPQNAYVFLRAGADLIGTRQAPQIIDSFDTMRKIGIIPPYEGE